MLGLFAALSLVCLEAAPPRASEQVAWAAPAECPGEAQVKARIDRILAEGGSGRREPVRLRLVVERVAEGFRLTAELEADDAPSGKRVVDGASCEDLAEAAVLIAAIAIDPDLVPPTPEQPEPLEPAPPEPEPPGAADLPAPPQPTEPQPAALKPEPVAPEPVAPDRPPRTTATDPIATPQRPRSPAVVVPIIAVDLGLGLGRLAAPVPMAMGRVGAGVEIGAFRGLARVSGFGPSRGEVEGFPGGGLFGATTGGIAGCGRTPGSRWSFVGCLATDVGVAFGRGRNTDIRRTARSLWWGIEAEAGVERALSPRWALALRGDAGVMPVPANFVVDGQGRACCVQWGAGLRLGVVGRFGPAYR
jgi:hypothetical protein